MPNTEVPSPIFSCLIEESEERLEPGLCLEGNCSRFLVLFHSEESDPPYSPSRGDGFQVMMLSIDTLFPPES